MSIRTQFAETASSAMPSPVANKLPAVVESSGCWKRMADHPLGLSVCLATGYVIFSGAYLIFSGRIAAHAAMSVEQLRRLELLKGLAFVVLTGAAYFGFAYHLLQRIATQQRHLALIFHSVSDCLFLLQVEQDESYRFLCVNASFLKVTGLAREQVVGKRLEEIVAEDSETLAKRKYREAIRSGKTLTWEQTDSYPAGNRVGEVTVTPLPDKSGKITQLACALRDVTERKLAEERNEAYGRRLQVLSRRLVEVQETERRYIACELHDEIGQALTAAQMNLQAVLQSSRSDAVVPRLKECLAEVEGVMEQVHSLSLDLRPSMLDDLGLEPALRWYTSRQGTLAGLQAKLVTDSLEHRYDPMIEIQCFRIAQEALTNVIRHAHADTVTVELHLADGYLHLSVRDDGIGFDVAKVRDQAVRGASLGLLSMEERATWAGGKLEINAIAGQGTDVHVWFPLAAHTQSRDEDPRPSYSCDSGR